MNSISKEIDKLQKENKKLILYDGVCGLCNSAIQWIIKKDTHKTFKFLSLQSDHGKLVLEHIGVSSNYTDSIILLDPNRAYYIKSKAALEIAKKLGKILYFLSLFLQILPIDFCDYIYDIISKNRYKWFGKNTCDLTLLNKGSKNAEDSFFL